MRSIGGRVARHLLRINLVGVIAGEVRQQAAAVGRLPPEQAIGKLGELRSPQQLLGDEVVNAGALVDLRQLPVVAEGVGVPTDVDVHPELLLEVALAVDHHPRVAVHEEGASPLTGRD